MKINLGSGNKRIKGYINIDKFDSEFVDVVHDLEKTPYPFKDNSIDEIRSVNIFEHLNNIDVVMNECHRILKEGGILLVKVPYFNSPTMPNVYHKTMFNYNWYNPFIGDKPSLDYVNNKEWSILSKKVNSTWLGRIILRLFGEKFLIKSSLVLGGLIDSTEVYMTPK